MKLIAKTFRARCVDQDAEEANIEEIIEVWKRFQRMEEVRENGFEKHKQREKLDVGR